MVNEMVKLQFKQTQEKIYTYLIDDVIQLNNTIFKVLLMPVLNAIKYTSGHYCQLLCSDNKFRAYSIANYPDEKGKIELHIRIKNHHIEMKQLIKVGKFIQLKGPYGKCIYNQKSRVPTIFLSEGIGIAAFYSIFDSGNFSVKNCLLLWLRQSDDHDYSAMQIEGWTKNIRRFKAHIMDISSTAYSDTLHYCKKFLSKNKKIRFYLAGSPAMKNYVINNFILSNNKNSIDFFCDI